MVPAQDDFRISPLEQAERPKAFALRWKQADRREVDKMAATSPAMDTLKACAGSLIILCFSSAEKPRRGKLRSREGFSLRHSTFGPEAFNRKWVVSNVHV